jgi:hypothetical protein
MRLMRQVGGDDMPRGLIINHKMGLGKTIAVLAIANDLQKAGFSTITIGPRTLAQNFEDNITKLRQTRPDVMDKGYSFFSLRANNLPEQIIRDAIYSGSKRVVAGVKQDIPTDVNLAKLLEGKVIIIDEAHLFCNSIAHGRDTALQMYRAIMAAKNVFIFLLTGTLVINSPFEAVPAFNMVSGKKLFPEDSSVFYGFFGTPERIIQNKGLLQNRVSGLISYAGWVDDESNNPDSPPTKLPIKVVRLPMEGMQISNYLEAREHEALEAKNLAKKKHEQVFTGAFGRDDSASSYKVRSRLASNGENKYKYIMERVMEHPRELVLVQAMFVERGGVKECARYVAERTGYEEFLVDNGGIIRRGPDELVGKPFVAMSDRDLTWENVPEPVVSKRYYFVLCGETSDEMLETALRVLCDPRNRHGAFIHVLYCSSVGSLGLDLKNGRHVIYMSMHFHLEEFHQTLARYIRLGASKLLPPEERNVQAHILLSVMPSNMSGQLDGDRAKELLTSTDLELFSLAMIKMKTNETFMNVIRGVSIECLAGISTNPALCRRCVPTNKLLMMGNFGFDMKLPSPCTEEQVGADLPRVEVVIGGKKHNVVYLKGDSFRAFEEIETIVQGGPGVRYDELSIYSPIYQAVRKEIVSESM